MRRMMALYVAHILAKNVKCVFRFMTHIASYIMTILIAIYVAHITPYIITSMLAVYVDHTVACIITRIISTYGS
jgi:hypothetical protein